MTPVLLTGDNPGAAGHVARQVGIDEVIADVTPAGKVDSVTRFQVVCGGSKSPRSSLGSACGVAVDSF